MKINPVVRGSLLAVLFLAVVFIGGCVTAPPVDWNSRVGHYTYAQAVKELGPPNREIRLSSGATKFKWFVQPAGGAGVNPGMPNNGLNNNGMNNSFGEAGPNPNPGFNNRYLQLTFDSNGVLTSWSKNY